MSIIEVRLYEDLLTRKQNELRYRLELAQWRKAWREAELDKDYSRMDWLDREFEKVGLP